MEYRPFDNSYCMNVVTRRQAYLVQKYSGDYSPDACERGAKFNIVCDVYVETCGKYELEFVNVKSDKTGNVYRTLYNRACVVKTS